MLVIANFTEKNPPMESETKQLYLDFDQYIRQGEPSRRKRAEAWSIAIGLQAVDGLTTSDYLQQTARRNIEGDISIDEARELIRSYYLSKNTREALEEDKEEADKVSANIAKILSSSTMDFSTNGLAAQGIDYTPVYLERFLRNLLSGEQWDLRNRYLHIYPAPEWSVQPRLDTPTSTPASTPTSLSLPDNKNLLNVILAIGQNQLSVKEIMQTVGLRDRENFMEYSLHPSIAGGYVRLRYPDKPRHPQQRYLLTEKGMKTLNLLTEKGK